ncbi:MAG: LysR family transcriptional regulator [Verrucomicrobiales bacterium]
MDTLNYHHLRYFWAVAREGSLRRASEILRVSQSSMSAQIKQLEDSLGSPLFRREGRGLALTEAGRSTFALAEKIFALGQDLVKTAKGEGLGLRERFPVGITDVLPKSVAHALLKPVLHLQPAPRLTVREGLMEDLLGLLQAGRIDLILANDPAPSGSGSTLFNHFLGSCGTTFMAARSAAGRYRERFPGSLHGAPALLPGTVAPVRRRLDDWLAAQGVDPLVVAEFDDPALMKVFAANGAGWLPVPSLVVEETKRRHGLEVIGTTDEVRESYHAITPGRQVENKAVAAILAASGGFRWASPPDGVK